MLNEHTITKMESLKLYGMAKTLKELIGSVSHHELSHEAFAGMLVDAEMTERENKRLIRYLKNARFKQASCIEDIDYRHPRGLHKQTILDLAQCRWVTSHHNVLISGPTGVGKSYIACALGNAACRKGSSVFYIRAPKLFTTLFQARADGSYLKYLAKLTRFNVVIIDDFGLAPMSDTERKDFMEIVEDRNLIASTIIASQVPAKDYYQIIGDPTIADAICDRLIHSAVKIELKGESLRKIAKQVEN